MNIRISKRPTGGWSIMYSGRPVTLAGAEATTGGEVWTEGSSKDAIEEAIKLTGKVGKEAFHLEELLRLRLKRSDKADVEVHFAPAAGTAAS